MAQAIDKTGCVALYAARIRYYANELVKTQLLEGQAGFDDEPWGMRYQRLAAKIYPENLPVAYLSTLANVFAGCALTMNAQPAPPHDVEEDWRIVNAYFTNASAAIAEVLEFEVRPEWEDPVDQNPTTPNNVRFDVLATYTTPEGAGRLRDAGELIASHFLPKHPLTEAEAAILADLANGASYLDTAHRHGYSSRTIYRKVSQICDKLGVEGKQQAITLAAHNNWI